LVIGFVGMSHVIQILDHIQQGDPQAAAGLLPLVYAELRRLAAAQLAREKPGQTLNATAPVHEAYLRLAGPTDEERWQSRGHFFAAAAEAMRHIPKKRACATRLLCSPAADERIGREGQVEHQELEVGA
jgi:RNA polymerase sigma factor (TIGR02999 family)